MLINNANLSQLYVGFNGAFSEGFGMAKPQWEQVATLVPSGTESNIYPFLGQFPDFRKWVGDRQAKDLEAFFYSLTNVPYESTVAVPAPKIKDDTYGVYGPLFKQMGYAAAMHPDSLVFAALAAGATTLCYDGQFFFDTDHPVGTAQKDNYDATGGGNLWALLDTRMPLKPLIFQKREDYNFQSFVKSTDEHVWKRNEFLYGVDARVVAGYGLWQLAYGSLNTLNATNVQAYVQKMMALKGNENQPLNVKPNLCVVGPSNWGVARDVFLVPTLSGGAQNPNFGMCDVVVTPYLP